MIRTVKDYEKLSEQYNKMLEERNSLIDDLSWYKAKVSRLEQRISKLVSENTKLQNELYAMGLNQDEADDKIKELERENRFLLSRKDNLFDSWRDENKRSVTLSKRLDQLKRKNGELQEVIEGKNSDLLFTEDENEQLKQDLLRTEELQDEIIQLEKDFENKHNLLSEISQHIGNKPSSSTYKYFRAKLDSIGIKEGE